MQEDLDGIPAFWGCAEKILQQNSLKEKTCADISKACKSRRAALCGVILQNVAISGKKQVNSDIANAPQNAKVANVAVLKKKTKNSDKYYAVKHFTECASARDS